MGRFCGELDLRARRNGRDWEVLRDFLYLSDSGFEVMVRKGFVTDGASVPRFLWGLVGSPMTGRYRQSTVVHDYVYRGGECIVPEKITRLEADRMMLEGMRDAEREFERGLKPRRGRRWLRWVRTVGGWVRRPTRRVEMYMMYKAVRLFGGGAWKRDEI